MAKTENLTNAYVDGDVITLPSAGYLSLTPQQQTWVDFRALNGLVFDETASETKLDQNGRTIVTGIPMVKMSTQQLADTLQVTRETLYDWTRKIPDFWEMVNARRIELAPRQRLTKMHEVWYLSALKPGNDGHRDRVLWLANFDPNFRMPTQPVKHDMGDSWAALLNAKAPQKQEPIEGEIVDAKPEN